MTHQSKRLRPSLLALMIGITFIVLFFVAYSFHRKALEELKTDPVYASQLALLQSEITQARDRPLNP